MEPINTPYQDNPFEVLGSSPAQSIVEIQDIARALLIDAETAEQKQHIREAYNRLTDPMCRLQHMVFCCPGIDLECEWHVDFPVVLAALRRAELPASFSLGLAAGLDAILRESVAYSCVLTLDPVTGSHSLDQDAWTRFMAQRDTDTHLVHSLAVLHHRWAFEFEDTWQEKLAAHHWHLALHYWARLARSSVFWDQLRAGLVSSSLWDDAGYGTYRSRFLQDKILRIHTTFAERYEAAGQAERGATHCALLRRAIEEFRARRWQDAAVAVEKTLDELASTYLARAQSELNKIDEVEPGLRRCYQSAIAVALRLLSLDPANLRALRFVVAECCDWCDDLYGTDRCMDIREAATLVQPYAARLTGLIAPNGGSLADRSALSKFYMLFGFSLMDEGLDESAWDEAEAAYGRSLELDPNNRNARELRAELFLVRAYRAHERRDYECALRMAERVETSLPLYGRAKGLCVEVHRQMAAEASRKGHLGEAERCLEQARELDPAHPGLGQELCIVHGLNLLRQAEKARDDGEYEQALGLVGQVEISHPLYDRAKGLCVEVHRQMAAEASRNGDLGEAERCLEQARELDPAHPGLGQELCIVHGLNLLRQAEKARDDGEYEQALGLAKQIKTSYPLHDKASEFRSSVYRAMSKHVGCG